MLRSVAGLCCSQAWPRAPRKPGRAPRVPAEGAAAVCALSKRAHAAPARQHRFKPLQECASSASSGRWAMRKRAERRPGRSRRAGPSPRMRRPIGARSCPCRRSKSTTCPTPLRRSSRSTLATASASCWTRCVSFAFTRPHPGRLAARDCGRGSGTAVDGEKVDSGKHTFARPALHAHCCL